MSNTKKTLLKYGVTIAIGAALVLLFLDLNGYALLTEVVYKYRLLADAFTIPGVTIVMVGFLVMVSNDGFFNGISYVVSYAVKMLIPGPNKGMESYGDYVERKRSRGKVRGYGFLFITGSAFVFVAVVFIILFYTA